MTNTSSSTQRGTHDGVTQWICQTVTVCVPSKWPTCRAKIDPLVLIAMKQLSLSIPKTSQPVANSICNQQTLSAVSGMLRFEWASLTAARRWLLKAQQLSTTPTTACLRVCWLVPVGVPLLTQRFQLATPHVCQVLVWGRDRAGI